MQYWCIDGTYIIDVARLRNEGKMSLREFSHPFRAEHIKQHNINRY